VVPQPCKPIIKQIPVPIREPAKVITKQVPVYIRTPIPVRVPQIIEKVVPQTVKQEVPIPQPPKIIEKQIPVPVQLPPKIIIREIRVPVVNGTACPPPQVIVQKVPVPQPPQIITKPVLVPTNVPPKILIKEVPVPYTPTSNVGAGVNCASQAGANAKCSLPTLPILNTCINPDSYVSQLILKGYSSDSTAAFRDSLIQLLKQQSVICQKTSDVPITPGVPVRPGVPTRPGVPIRPGLPNRSGVAIPPAIPVRPTSCQNIKRKLLRQIKHFASRLCYYKKTAKRLKFQLKQLLVSNLSPTSLQTSKQLPAVPIPMMHVMKSLTPSMPLSPFQHVSSSVDLTRASFIKSFQQVYKNTQEALTHCMDAILAQTLITQSQINAKCNNCHQFIKDRELAENQIKFLNSIIVDIQKKNEEQKARIEILESGYSPAMADELKL
jgi:hypothetical protein